MPPHNWPDERQAVLTEFLRRHPHPEGGALLHTAFDCADSLFYLEDIDKVHDSDNGRSRPDRHSQDVIDVGHARWASGSAITALDLVAASFGRCFLQRSGPIELDIGMFCRPPKAVAKDLARVPGKALEWVKQVSDDGSYQQLSKVRHALTHRRLARHLYVDIGTAGPNPRLELSIGSEKIPVRHVVLQARDVATMHLTYLLKLLPQL